MTETGATPSEARALAEAFRALNDWAFGGTAGAVNEVVSLIRDYLGAAGVAESVVTRALPPYEHVNLQMALNRWSAAPGRTVEVHGLSLPPHYGGIDLQQLLTGEGLPPVRLTAPGLVDLPSGPNSTLACLQRALLLVTDARGAYVVMVRGPERHEEPELAVELAGLAVADAQAVLEELAALRAELNVYRGQLLELHPDPAGGVAIDFVKLPPTRREEVVLPETVLHRIERHTLDVARHRAQLRSAGQHLKRGLLLYGPPGTGKTHTTRYVIGQLTGSTVLLLSGRSLRLIGAVAGLARDLQPAVVVLEDVDLIAEDRGYGPGSNPVLFELLDAMDGAAADADLLFLLTTNRADLLEPALAARPGRVDVAVEIGLPDAGARRRLLELYGRGVPLVLTDADVDAAVERTAGTTASFIKELLRRAVLEALTESDELADVTGAHLGRALDDLLDSNQQVTRACSGWSRPVRPAPPAGTVDCPSWSLSSTIRTTESDGRGMAVQFLALSFDANDPVRLAQFWGAVLGRQLADDPTAASLCARVVMPSWVFGFCPLAPWRAETHLGGPPLNPKIDKSRLHVDLAVPTGGDHRTEVDRLVSLGAMPIEVGQGEVSWVVMADPDGREFCVYPPAAP